MDMKTLNGFGDTSNFHFYINGHKVGVKEFRGSIANPVEYAETCKAAHASHVMENWNKDYGIHTARLNGLFYTVAYSEVMAERDFPETLERRMIRNMLGADVLIYDLPGGAVG